MGLNFSIDNYLRLSWQDILLTCISTLIIVLVARHFFWDKLMAFLAKRQAFINQNLEDSVKARDEAYQLRNDYSRQLNELHAREDDMMQAAKARADRKAKEIIAAADEEARYRKQAAQEEIELEMQKANREIEQAITDIAFSAASKVLEQDLDEKRQKELIARFIEETSKS